MAHHVWIPWYTIEDITNLKCQEDVFLAFEKCLDAEKLTNYDLLNVNNFAPVRFLYIELLHFRETKCVLCFKWK